jgi:hypothetical protein
VDILSAVIIAIDLMRTFMGDEMPKATIPLMQAK